MISAESNIPWVPLKWTRLQSNMMPKRTWNVDLTFFLPNRWCLFNEQPNCWWAFHRIDDQRTWTWNVDLIRLQPNCIVIIEYIAKPLVNGLAGWCNWVPPRTKPNVDWTWFPPNWIARIVTWPEISIWHIFFWIGSWRSDIPLSRGLADQRVNAHE